MSKRRSPQKKVGVVVKFFTTNTSATGRPQAYHTASLIGHRGSVADTRSVTTVIFTLPYS